MMKTKLTALLAGTALFGLAGAAQADSVAPTWSVPSDTAGTANTQVVTLTDTQMDGVTAAGWVEAYPTVKKWDKRNHKWYYERVGHQKYWFWCPDDDRKPDHPKPGNGKK